MMFLRMYIMYYVYISIAIQTTCKTLEDRISQLEQLLAEETKRVEQLEQESVKQFEAEESLAKLKAALEEKDAQIKLLTDSSVSQVNNPEVCYRITWEMYVVIKYRH